MSNSRRYVIGWYPLAPDGGWQTDATPGADRITVHEPELRTRSTGLVDPHGVPIMAVDERPAAAFVRWENG